MSNKKSISLRDIPGGKMPCDIIKKTLGIYVEPGDVVLSVAAQKHIIKRHPGELEYILPRLSQVIENPLYIGDDHRNPGKIEFVTPLPARDRFILISVTIEKNSGENNYHVCSAFLISQSKTDKRRNEKILLVAK